MTNPPHDPWRLFRDNRPLSTYVYLNTAAAGRSSRKTLATVSGFLERESVAGAYVAAAEAEGVISAGRATLAELMGVEAGGIAFVESASAALAGLLRAWPLMAGTTVAVVPSEWGPNLDAFTDRGLRVAQLAVDGAGLVDLDALRQFVAMTPPAFVHLTMVASHRPLVQPVAEAVAICHAAGIPVWVDAAQALGHVDTACGADVVYSTSRKWLCGPRGVGVIGVTSSWWRQLRPRASEKEREELPVGASPVLLMESGEANVAGRIGLCAALGEHVAAGPAAVRARLAEVGAMTREALADVPGWEVVAAPEGAAGACAIVALRPTAGQRVAGVCSFLLAEYQIVTTNAARVRAPKEMKESYLRVSPHVDVTPEDLALLRKALPPK
ncbi:MAG TPA: aminotransferase class V-fold PLP-dependent enzyme [Trebonia sp.]|nr:aminotransferase class V-fold PLP-dependent enzyme [Trebonia sp.]